MNQTFKRRLLDDTETGDKNVALTLFPQLVSDPEYETLKTEKIRLSENTNVD